MSNDQIFEIAIMARLTWDLHSLNNEGSVGNVVEPRTVVLADGSKTDGVSGEMLKHVHTVNLWKAAGGQGLCPACARLQPQKADLPEYRRTFKGTNIEVMSQAIAGCAGCDLHGFLVQAPAIARKSTVEFGWAVGVPQRFHRDIHIHARHSMEGRGAERQQEEVAAQMVYHRPTRSGVYALVSLYQPWRIGLNEIDYTYAVADVTERQRRYRLGLEAYKATLLRTDGAMTSTRLPNLEGLEGVVAVSRTNFPAPVFSPLRDDYQAQVEAVVNRLEGVVRYPFASLDQFLAIMDELAQEEIHTLRGRR